MYQIWRHKYSMAETLQDIEYMEILKDKFYQECLNEIVYLSF